MIDPMNRRQFFGSAGAAGLALGLAGPSAAQQSPGDKIVIGVMGTGGRGTSLARSFEGLTNVEVTHVCDVDRKRAERAAQVAGAVKKRKITPVIDYRRILDNKDVNVLVVAASNHWHAPAAIAGCAAGKHVYVEKPCSHNPREGELMVTAARKYNRVVQMGNQRRSMEKYIEGIEEIRKGAIGRAYFSRSIYANNRPSIGKGKRVAPPPELNFDLWQGPAPRRPFRTNILHYNWHWFWHWGNGELGNNGVHSVDISRWALGVDYPTRVVASGGRYHFDDDQETPDTCVASWEFEGGKRISWEGLSCNRGFRLGPYITVHGTEGTLAFEGSGYTLYDSKNKEVKKANGPGGHDPHLQNFLDAIRGKAKLNSEIEEGHKSTLLCHLGNIAYRTGHALTCDPKGGHIQGDPEATKLWSREYEPGWEPKL